MYSAQITAKLLLVCLLCPALVMAAAAPSDQPETRMENTTAAAATTDNTPKLSVFMESLCPDTRRFFRDQLLPAQRQLGDIFKLELVPFGHARVLGNNKMVCQHGPRECEGNRRMACILARTNNQTELVETFSCLLRLDKTPAECVAENLPKVSFEELEKCTSGDESYRLMEAAEKESGRLAYVPHLAVDGKSDDQIQDQAENHLEKYLCALYKGPTPPAVCKTF